MMVRGHVAALALGPAVCTAAASSAVTAGSLTCRTCAISHRAGTRRARQRATESEVDSRRADADARVHAVERLHMLSQQHTICLACCTSGLPVVTGGALPLKVYSSPGCDRPAAFRCNTEYYGCVTAGYSSLALASAGKVRLPMAA